jgi:hypothetical protein
MSKKSHGRKGKAEPSRRDFLKCGMTAAGLAAGGAAMWLYFREPEDPFDFAAIRPEDVERVLKPIKGGHVERNYPAISPKMDIRKSPAPWDPVNQREQINGFLSSELSRRGFKSKAFLAKGTNQWFGIPDEPHLVEHVIDYSRKALDFMYGQEPWLKRVELKWTPLTGKESHELDYHGRAFVGKGVCVVQSVTATGKEYPAESLSITRNVNKAGGYNVRFPDGSWFVFIPCNSHALEAVFSETLPFCHPNRNTKSREELERIIIEDETLEEAASYLMSSMVATKFRVPGGPDAIKSDLRRIEIFPRYKHVRLSIAYMDKNGIKAAWDLFTESPKKYMTAIGAYK